MSQGLATTFQVLSKTDNAAAVPVLLPALDSSRPAIRDGALMALLNRREPVGHREILARVPNLSLHWKKLIRQRSDRMSGMLRAALVEADEASCLNACRAAVMFEDFDVIPALLVALENGSPNKAVMASEALLQLAAQLSHELSHPRKRTDGRDPPWCRRHVLSSLENSVQRFGHHRRREVMEAFLLLADPSNPVLNQILLNPHHVGYLIIFDVLSKSVQNGIMNLLLSFLDVPQSPSAILGIIANRNDPKFIRLLLRKIGHEPSLDLQKNLKRIENFVWLKNADNVLDYLDNASQQSAVVLIVASGIPRTQAFPLIRHLLLYGKPGGRREAASALADFAGAEANSLAIKMLSDPDPQVQAHILRHIRQRGIPGLLPRLTEFIDSPHLEVRQAARQSLSEFTIKQFLDDFDLLSDEVRATTGKLVMKIDPQTFPRIHQELQSVVRTRRLKGLQIVRVLGIADRFEDQIVECLADGDTSLRLEALLTLAKSRSVTARQALVDATLDENFQVRETATKILEEDKA